MERALTVKGGQLSDKVGEKTALGETKSGSKRVRQRDDVSPNHAMRSPLAV